MKEAVIVSAVRTPIGAFRGSFEHLAASELGGIVIKEAIERAGIKNDQIDEVIMGNVLQAAQGQNPARQAAVKAGIPYDVPAWTVNQVCASGLKSIISAAQAILTGDANIVVAGGMENMSMAPYAMLKARSGYHMGNQSLVDTMINDGLTDSFLNIHMGLTAEKLAQEYSISREDQDRYAVMSQNRAEKATHDGEFRDEIVPVTIPQKKGDTIVVDTDEYPRFGLTYEGISRLKPAFESKGTVTAGNASGINDGAAAVVVMEKETAKDLGLEPLAKITAWASIGLDPLYMGLGPIHATRKVLKKADLDLNQIDLFEINEAFSATALAVIRELGLDVEKTNVNGGAIALGHPIGASGTRIVVTLLHALRKRNLKRCLATLCVGGGQGTAMILER